MVNLFPEAVPEGGKEAGFLQRCPGLSLLATIGTGPIRGLWSFGGLGYVVSGTELYTLNTDWTYALIGTVAGSGPVSIADNGTQMFIAANGPGYIYNASTAEFAMITDVDFAGAVTVGYIDGYFVFNEPNSQRVWITSLLDGTSIDPLEFASAEGNPDNLIALMVDHREIWMFGANSIEVWYDAGTVDFPLQRIQGAFNELGCAAPYSIAKLDNALFWLGSDARGKGVVYRSNGYAGQRISTHAVEWQIQQYSTLADAVGYTYQQDGHAFYVLNFPDASSTWVYDVATQAWHERADFADVLGVHNPALPSRITESGNVRLLEQAAAQQLIIDADQFTRHRGSCQMAFNNQIVIGDYTDGRVYAYDLDTYQGKWLRSWRALPTGQNNLKRTAHHSLQLDCEAGIGLNTGQGSDPQVMLRWSDDGGHTWSNSHWASMGRIGEHYRRVVWRRLGMTTKLRDRVYEISGTDPVKIAIMGAELLLSGTNA